MSIPLQVAFKHVDRSEWVLELVQGQLDKLATLFDEITSCRVIVEMPHKHHLHGNLYKVTVDLKIPGEEFVVSRESADHHSSEDLHVAISDAFEKAKQQMSKYVSKRRASDRLHHTKERHFDFGDRPFSTDEREVDQPMGSYASIHD